MYGTEESTQYVETIIMMITENVMMHCLNIPGRTLKTISIIITVHKYASSLLLYVRLSFIQPEVL